MGRPREVGDDTIGQIIVDTLQHRPPGEATHWSAKSIAAAHNHRWLLRHPCFVLCFAPTGSSGLSLVERWSGELTTRELRRSSHATVKALAEDIIAWTNTWNTNPTPYRWVKTADAIFESIASHCQHTSDSGH